MEQGDRHFEAGDYANAVIAYAAYVREQPNGLEADHALFRLALVHALPGHPAQNQDQAIAYLNELVSRFPQSPLRPEAELLLQKEQQIISFRSEIAQREMQVEVLTRQMEELRQAGGEELDQLRADLKGREERVRQLSEELDRLKAIDMQRRASPPPR